MDIVTFTIGPVEFSLDTKKPCTNPKVLMYKDMMNMVEKYRDSFKAGSIVANGQRYEACYITKDNAPLKGSTEIFVIDEEGDAGPVDLSGKKL